MSRLTRDGTAEPVSRDQVLRRERGQGNIHFPCSADHEHDWQPYPVDPYSAICDDHTYIHTYCRTRAPNLVWLDGTIIVYYYYPLTMVSSVWWLCMAINRSAGRPGSSEVPRNPLTRWDVSSIPANGIILTKKLKN